MGGEETFVGHFHDAPVLQVAGFVAPRQHHPARAPGKLVAQGVVVGIGGRQAAAIGAERLDLPAGVVHPVDNAHGRHVVNAGVEAHFIEQDDASLPRRAVQRPHLVFHVGSGDQVAPMADALLSHLHVVDVG